MKVYEFKVNDRIRYFGNTWRVKAIESGETPLIQSVVVLAVDDARGHPSMMDMAVPMELLIAGHLGNTGVEWFRPVEPEDREVS